MDFKQELVKLLSKETKLKDVESILGIPPDQKLGDYAFPCFKLGKNPKEAAEKLKEKLKLPKFIQKTQVVGPYLNFYLDKSVLAQKVLTKIDGKYGQGKSKEKIVLEYCGPNTNKPLHLGHVRNMALGNAMVKILKFQGNKVHPVNIINDRGIHICKSMLAYQKWGKDKLPDKKSDHFVGDYYVLFAKKAKDNPELENEAQEMLVKWESSDPETRKLWKKMNSWVLKGFAQTYERFGISFEKEYFESELYEKGKDLVLDGLKKEIFHKDERLHISVDLEKYGLPNKVVLREDGTSVYMTQDLYLAQEKYSDYKYDKSFYVVATEQNLHFKQLFKILELLKKPFAGKSFHLGYGLVHLPSGRMKSREGTVVDADDIMDEISELALKEVEKRYKDLSKKEKDRRSEFISLAAIKFFMLRTDQTRDITFDPKESLRFEGETGPYLQYTHARACAILRKSPKQTGKVNYTELSVEQEQQVVVRLSKFSEVIEGAASLYKPHLLCRYLIDLAQEFNEFYHACPVISEDKSKMKARLLLVDSVRQVLENGLGLLGIEAPSEM